MKTIVSHSDRDQQFAKGQPVPVKGFGNLLGFNGTVRESDIVSLDMPSGISYVIPEPRAVRTGDGKIVGTWKALCVLFDHNFDSFKKAGCRTFFVRKLQPNTTNLG